MELYFKPLELSIEDAANRFNISESELLSLVKGRIGISEDTAPKLAQAFQTTTEYWLNMQVNYDLSRNEG